MDFEWVPIKIESLTSNNANIRPQLALFLVNGNFDLGFGGVGLSPSLFKCADGVKGSDYRSSRCYETKGSGEAIDAFLLSPITAFLGPVFFLGGLLMFVRGTSGHWIFAVLGALAIFLSPILVLPWIANYVFQD